MHNFKILLGLSLISLILFSNFYEIEAKKGTKRGRNSRCSHSTRGKDSRRASSSSTSSKPKPNIILILADDLGWSDVGWRNPAMRTPTLDKMARGGLIMNQSYVQSTCSPSRAALMAARYAYHLGFQHNTAGVKHALHLPDDQPILPQALKSLGYSTHMLGKWHLGFCNWKYTPTYRGFDTFYGFYNAGQDHYTHIQKGGYDFRDDDQVDKSAAGHYTTDLLTERAQRILTQHDYTSNPLFLYFAMQNVHAPLEVDERYKTQYCSHISDPDRKTKCGMIAIMDEAVKNVTDTLEQLGQMNNTLIVFSSDNGGPVHEASSNWPLRGSKITIWEGGTRAAGFVYAPGYLQVTNASYEQLFHIVDWYPTFVEAAGGDPSSIANIDGVSQWQALTSNSQHGPRHEFIYNIDDINNSSAIRVGRFKLVQGCPCSPNGWFPPAEMPNEKLEEITGGHKHMPPYQLFNLNTDPEERKDILSTHQDVADQLKQKLEKYRSTIKATVPDPIVHHADYRFFGGNWSPGWC